MRLRLRALAAVFLASLLLPEAHAAATADEVVVQLNALTKGHVYRGNRYAEGILYDHEKIVKVEFEPSQRWLGVTVDDTRETAPVTVIVPLWEATVGPPHADTFSFSCGSPCIKTTRDRFATAVQKLSAGRGAELRSAQNRNTIQFGCRAERCVPIRQAILELVDKAKRASPAEKPPDAAAIVARINVLTAKLEYLAPDGTRVLSYRYATTLNHEKRVLTVIRDVESFVAKSRTGSRSRNRITIPLSEVSAVSLPKRFHQPPGLTLEVHEVGFACHQKKRCVEAADPGKGTRNVYQAFGYECAASRSLELKQALEQLVVTIKASRP